MNIDFFINLPKSTILKLSNESYYKHSFSVCEFSPKNSKGIVILYGCCSNKITDVMKELWFSPILKISPCNNVVNMKSYENGDILKYILMKKSNKPSKSYYCFENKYLPQIINMDIPIYSDYNDQGFEEIDISLDTDENCNPEDYYFAFPGDYGFILGEDYKKLNN